MASTERFSGFDSISESMYYHPSKSRLTLRDTTTESSPPGLSLIVLCTRTAAKPKHIAKYTQAYQKRFPDASILVVQTLAFDAVLRLTDASHLGRLSPACEIILKHRGEPSLLQAFSNGGALTASLILNALSRRRMPMSGTPENIFDAVIFDSCPGQAYYWQTTKAVITTMELPKLHPVTYIIGSAMLHLALLGLVVLRLLGVQNMLSRARDRFNNSTFMATESRRLYIYSKSDLLVDWTDVHSHALAALVAGYVVHELVFQDTGHCCHAMADAERYWSTINRFIAGMDEEKRRP